jgi:hypothetical protein
MAQIISSPGQNQAAGTVVVAPDLPEYGASAARAIATVTTVAYTQNEPGWGERSDGSKPKRS